MGSNIDSIWVITVLLGGLLAMAFFAIMYFGVHTYATYILAVLIFVKTYNHEHN